MSMTAEHSLPRRVAALFELVRSYVELIPLSVLQLAMRLAVGAVFFRSGLLKIRSWEFAVKLFEDEYKVPLLDPELAARLATFNELVFSVLVIIGLATRIAALPLLAMVFVIQVFVYPNAWSDHLMWGSILVFLISRGPGSLSVDAWLCRLSARRTKPGADE